MENNKPGDVIAPAQPPLTDQPPSQPTSSQPPTEMPVEALNTPPPLPERQPSTTEPSTTWQYNGAPEPASSQANPATSQPSSNETDSIAWSAVEFIHHEKSALWYTVLVGSGVAFIALVYLVTHDKITSTILGLAVAALAVFAGRKPRTVDYEINDYAIRIGRQVYDFSGFKSFAVYEEADTASIVLMPLKRFMPPLMVYLDQQVETAVVGLLSERLPLSQHPQDSLDSLLRKLRF